MPVQAAVLTYDYEGPVLSFEGESLADFPLSVGETFGGHRGRVVLSEEIFGGSLAGQSVSIGCNSGPTPDYVLSAAFNGDVCNLVFVQNFEIIIDEDLEISGWFIDILDGPPDYFSFPGRDEYEFGDGSLYSSRDGGTWTLTSVEGDLAPVPLPAGGWLVATALAGLAGLRRLRR